MAIPCTPWTLLQNANPAEYVNKIRAEAMPLLKFCLEVAKYQNSKGKYFVIENPLTSRIWYTTIFQEINSSAGSYLEFPRPVSIWTEGPSVLIAIQKESMFVAQCTRAIHAASVQKMLSC